MVANCLARTAGRLSAASRTAVPSRMRVVVAATAVKKTRGSSQWPSGPVGWRPPAVPPIAGFA